MTNDEQQIHDEALREWQQMRRTRLQQAQQEDCLHAETKCGMCIECGLDVSDDIVSRAEAAADAREDR